MFSVFPDPFLGSLVAVASTGLLALLSAGMFRVLISMRSPGTEKMELVSLQLHSHVFSYLHRICGMGIVCLLAIAALVYCLIDTGFLRLQSGNFGIPWIAGSVLFGGCLSFLTGMIGASVAVSSSVRMAQAARTSMGQALRTGFLGAAAPGLFTTGCSLLGLTGILLTFTYLFRVPFPETLNAVIGFVAGASVATFFLRVGGGIVSAAMSAISSPQDAEHPSANLPIAGNFLVGVSGMGAHMFENVASILAAAMLIGLSIPSGSVNESAVLFPMLVSALSILSCILSSFAVRIRRDDGNVLGALKSGTFLSSILLAGGVVFLAKAVLPGTLWLGVSLAGFSGIAASWITGMLLEYVVSDGYPPAKKLSSSGGLTFLLFGGITLGFSSILLPLIVILIVTTIAYSQAGVYGIAIAALCMLSPAVSVSVSGFHPITRAGVSIARIGKLSRHICVRTETLDRAAGTAASVVRGGTVLSEIPAILSLFAVLMLALDVAPADVSLSHAVIPLLIGSIVPFAASSIVLAAVGHGALRLLKGMHRTEQHSSALLKHLTWSSVRRTTLLGVVAVLLPIGVGLLAGASGLSGFFGGVFLTGIPITLAMTNAGGAWVGARQSVEAGNSGGEGSDAHTDARSAEKLGSAFRDAVAPSILVTLQLMVVMSLLTASFFG